MTFEIWSHWASDNISRDNIKLLSLYLYKNRNFADINTGTLRLANAEHKNRIPPMDFLTTPCAPSKEFENACKSVCKKHFCGFFGLLTAVNPPKNRSQPKMPTIVSFKNTCQNRCFFWMSRFGRGLGGSNNITTSQISRSQLITM